MLDDLPAGHGLFAEDGLIARLRDLTRTDWEAYIGHDFVRGLGRGDLPRPAFRQHLVQKHKSGLWWSGPCAKTREWSAEAGQREQHPDPGH